MTLIAESDNRRKWARIPMCVPLFVRGVDKAGKPFLEFGTAINISAGGVLLALKQPIPPHRRLSVEVPVAPGPLPQVPEGSRRVAARIVRCTEERDCRLVGIQFLTPLGESKKVKGAEVGS